MLNDLAILFLALAGVWSGLQLMHTVLPGPYRFLSRWVRRLAARLWDVMYRIPATRRGRVFGLFWLGCILWAVILLGVIFQGGQVLGVLVITVTGFLLAGFRWLIAWLERRAAARVQRPLPHREQWR
jgi:hypothetical protein